MSSFPNLLMGVGFLIIPVFLIYIVIYYSALYEFTGKIKTDYPTIWDEFSSKAINDNSIGLEIGYQILRAIAVKQINVEGETKIFAATAWRYQNIGAIIFTIAVLCLLTGKTLTQLH